MEKVQAWKEDVLVQVQAGLFGDLLASEGVLYGDKTVYNIQQDMGGISLVQYTLKSAFESGIDKGNFILFIKVPKTYIGSGKIPNFYGHVTKRITIKDPYVALLMRGMPENLDLENAIEEVKTGLYAPNSYLGQLLLTEGEVTENGLTVKLPIWKNISKTEFDAFVNSLIY